MAFILTLKRRKTSIAFANTLICLLVLNNSCTKLIEVNTPTTSISGKNVYNNDNTAIAVITSMYGRISSASIMGTELTSIGLLTGLAGDELALYSGAFDQRLFMYYQNNLNAASSGDFWTTIYNEIYNTNLAINGLSNSTALNEKIKNQLLGEAKFFRALCYFYLVNLYGPVPIVISTDYTENNILSRSPTTMVWEQILSDLNEAKNLLSKDYLGATLLSNSDERVRPTKWAATSLLARSYLYVQDWKNAEIESSEVIDNANLYSLDSLNSTFLMNSREAIWQLQPVNYGLNTVDAQTYIIPSTGPSDFNPVYISPELLNSFELNDGRKEKWIDTVRSEGTLYHYAFKYKSALFGEPITEYHTVLRLAEQYLIRAEARAQLEKNELSRNDINMVRTRAGLNEINTNDQTLLLDTIYHERQVELFTEWGHRWLDLKRLQKINDRMSIVTPLKGGVWSSSWQFLPIPSSDIMANGNLVQNKDY